MSYPSTAYIQQGWDVLGRLHHERLTRHGDVTPRSGDRLVAYNGSLRIYATHFFFPQNISIGYVFNGPTTHAEFTEHNLTAGTTWGVSVDGYSTQTNGTTINISATPTERRCVRFGPLRRARGMG